MHEKIFFRRCHICGSVTEAHGQPVARCGHCAKTFAPFYYFDVLHIPISADNLLRPPLLPGERSPIVGLTSWW